MPNQILIYGSIGEDGITARQIKTTLASMDSAEPLVVRIDSEGGSVFDGLAMYESFANYPGPKKAVIESTAFSIASYIAMAFDEVEIVENGYVMIHEPRIGEYATASELTKSAALLEKLQKDMVSAYSRKTGLPEQQVVSMMAADTYMNAAEAVAMGFVNTINPIRVPTRVVPQSRHSKMPQRVYAALFGAGSDGENREPTKEKPVSTESQKPVAASIKEIKAAYPKMKDSFYIGCLEKELPLASVATAAVEELMAENADLMTKCKAMEEQLAAKAESETVTEDEPADAMEETPVEATAPKARAGVTPVARVTTSTAPMAATEKWNSLVEAAIPKANGDRMKAVAMVNRMNPGLREKMVAESNKSRK